MMFNDDNKNMMKIAQESMPFKFYEAIEKIENTPNSKVGGGLRDNRPSFTVFTVNFPKSGSALKHSKTPL